MGHTIGEKAKLLARVRRIKGQCEAVERALEAGEECSTTLQLIAAARGAMNGLMSEVLEQHVVAHILGGKTPRDRNEAAGQLVGVVRTYLK